MHWLYWTCVRLWEILGLTESWIVDVHRRLAVLTETGQKKFCLEPQAGSNTWLLYPLWDRGFLSAKCQPTWPFSPPPQLWLGTTQKGQAPLQLDHKRHLGRCHGCRCAGTSATTWSNNGSHKLLFPHSIWKCFLNNGLIKAPFIGGLDWMNYGCSSFNLAFVAFMLVQCYLTWRAGTLMTWKLMRRVMLSYIRCDMLKWCRNSISMGIRLKLLGLCLDHLIFTFHWK